MQELLFTSDKRLLDGGRELVNFDSTVGPFGRFSDPGGEYDIVRRKRSGWHLELKGTRTGQQVCEFRPNLFRRGGKLLGAQGTARLEGRPLIPSHWRFTLEGSHVDAVAHAALVNGRSTWRLEVRLRSDDVVGASPIAPLTLAFGCWLIVEWEIEGTAGGH